MFLGIVINAMLILIVKEDYLLVYSVLSINVPRSLKKVGSTDCPDIHPLLMIPCRWRGTFISVLKNRNEISARILVPFPFLKKKERNEFTEKMLS